MHIYMYMYMYWLQESVFLNCIVSPTKSDKVFLLNYMYYM